MKNYHFGKMIRDERIDKMENESYIELNKFGKERLERLSKKGSSSPINVTNYSKNQESELMEIKEKEDKLRIRERERETEVLESISEKRKRKSRSSKIKNPNEKKKEKEKIINPNTNKNKTKKIY